ncbi:hypothetical protein JXB28_05305 [Candidatus Woesearchaeota archaeon]|nr:hypothetical protein [Candidatus Woesearchaeota archaeon]
MGLGIDEEVMHYLNARRTYSRDRKGLEEDYLHDMESLDQILNDFPDVRIFLGEEERIWYDYQLKELAKRGRVENHLGYALLFHQLMKPFSEHQSELRENLGVFYYNQYYIYRGLFKVKQADEKYLSSKALVSIAQSSDEENSKLSEKLLASLPKGLNITQSDADFLDYYKRRTEYERYVFAGLRPYRESLSELREHISFYTYVSSFMLSIKRSIEECEKILKSHLGRWNI